MRDKERYGLTLANVTVYFSSFIKPMFVQFAILIGGGCSYNALGAPNPVQSQIAKCQDLVLKEPSDKDIFKDDVGILYCSTTECGGNSPSVNGFPLNGLNSGGCLNAQKIKLVTKSIRGSHNPYCNNETLDSDEHGRLIAVYYDGNTKYPENRCKYEDLNDAYFTIENSDGTFSLEIKIQLSDYLSHKSANQAFQGYQFTITRTQISLCRIKNLTTWNSSLGLSGNQYDANIRHDINNTATINDIAIIVPGELYSKYAFVLPGSQNTGWFNIACQRDALARLDIFNIAPHVNGSQEQNYLKKRAAALKMMTANYCDTTQYTYEGNEIIWESRLSNGWTHHPDAKPELREAVWDDTGAICVEHIRHARLFPENRIGQIPRALLPKRCLDNPDKCAHEDEFSSALRDECRRSIAKSCEGKKGLFRSYRNPNQTN